MKDSDTRHVHRCMQPAPKSLVNETGAFKCRLETNADGHHDGPHKATRTVKGIGKVTVRWLAYSDPSQPPEIIL